MKTKNQVTFLMIFLAVIMVLAVPVWSQEKPADNMKIVLENIRADKKLLIAKAMKLTESEAEAFWPVYNSYQKKLWNLIGRLIKVIENYVKNYTLTNEDAKGLLDEYLAIERGHLKIRDTYLPKFRKVLPEKKVFLYYQLENKIEAGVNVLLADQIPLIK
jgi:hypothetical protein